MRGTAERAKPRRMWLTAPLYAIAIAVMVVDVWAAAFWAAVGGQLGIILTVAAAVVVLLLAALLLTDARRQWRLSRWVEDRPTG